MDYLGKIITILSSNFSSHGYRIFATLKVLYCVHFHAPSYYTPYKLSGNEDFAYANHLFSFSVLSTNGTQNSISNM